MNTNRIARIARLVGEPARTSMLVELMDGRALTANELARAAGVSAPTASAHLAQLLDAGLLRVAPAGRHRYFRLASGDVARMLETIMQVAAGDAAGRPRLAVGPKDDALRTARTCYDHLAGRLGVAIAQRLTQDGSLLLDDEQAYLTDKGRCALRAFGIAAATDGANGDANGDANGTASKARSSAFSCRPCLDWSERRFHLAGRLASNICGHCIERGWLRRRSASRSLDITPPGRLALQDWLGTALWRGVMP